MRRTTLLALLLMALVTAVVLGSRESRFSAAFDTSTSAATAAAVGARDCTAPTDTPGALRTAATTPDREVAAPDDRPGLRVLGEAEFFARMRALGLQSSPATFSHLHDQRPDLGALAALVTDDRGMYVTGARVLLEIANQETMRHHVGNGDYSPEVMAGRTEADGVALFKNLAPGSYLLATEHRDYVTRYLGSVDVPIGSTTYVEIVLVGPDAHIAGKVRAANGSPLADAAVTVRRYTEGGAAFSATARTEHDGSFRLGVQADTQNVVIATCTGYRDARLEAIAAGTEDLEITLHESPTATIRGHVTEGLSDEPIRRFAIDGTAFLAFDGAFAIERNVRAAPHVLVFSAIDHEPRTVRVPLSTEADVDLGRVALHGGRELNGIVLRGEGED
ncbi:MAG: carboxypeptidase regulatory-like domain-containing protein [Planctomycetes bacterium]|nr:carboxypeptidase regulatory-like domain-containing protein [Planctomycetota bacterium]